MKKRKEQKKPFLKAYDHLLPPPFPSSLLFTLPHPEILSKESLEGKKEPNPLSMVGGWGRLSLISRWITALIVAYRYEKESAISSLLRPPILPIRTQEEEEALELHHQHPSNRFVSRRRRKKGERHDRQSLNFF